MECKTFGAVSEKEDLFSYNEERANHYAATCLKFAAIVSALMWILNILGFFIVDKTSMNIVIPTGILLFLLPAARKRLNLKLGRGERSSSTTSPCFAWNSNSTCPRRRGGRNRE